MEPLQLNIQYVGFNDLQAVEFRASALNSTAIFCTIAFQFQERIEMKKEISAHIPTSAGIVILFSILFGLWYFAVPHATKKVNYQEMSPVQ